MLRVGLISDTHGLLRPAALDFLRGCARIIHAGDIGDVAVLEALATLAPVTAVRGNNDHQAVLTGLPETAQLELDHVQLYVLHNLKEMAIDPAAAGVNVVVSGHSHRPLVEEREGVLYVNPGSAGRRRFKLPIGVGELVIDGREVMPRIVELDG
ncbi:metallophosphoesterase family protein [Frateuria sp. STR12]|uniref:metallophosphoesterase family protein n=1 Tax=Frateuria hangzhouensis TaxID=2995589 RepID=UPI002260DE16|nr:metallophosphoesterase family protein [Frateuria sp. STR12]MCX7513515.1 metallophosphoesterase family protein [Frateuria sp. STR12]